MWSLAFTFCVLCHVYWYTDVVPASHSQNNANLIMAYNFLMYCWIWFANILLKILASMFIRDIRLWFSFLVVSLSGFGIRIIPVSSVEGSLSPTVPPLGRVPCPSAPSQSYLYPLLYPLLESPSLWPAPDIEGLFSPCHACSMAGLLCPFPVLSLTGLWGVCAPVSGLHVPCLQAARHAHCLFLKHISHCLHLSRSYLCSLDTSRLFQMSNHRVIFKK